MWPQTKVCGHNGWQAPPASRPSPASLLGILRAPPRDPAARKTNAARPFAISRMKKDGIQRKGRRERDSDQEI